MVYLYPEKAAEEVPTLDPTRRDQLQAQEKQVKILKMILLILLALPYYSHGGTATPAKPSLSLTPTAIKNFNFTWNDIEGETSYKLLEKPNEKSDFTEIAKLAANSTSYIHTVPLHKRVNAQYILEACNDASCTPSIAVSVTDTWVDAIGYFKASSKEEYGGFGNSVSLSDDGNTLAVGVPKEGSNAKGIGGSVADNSVTESGAAYVFSRHRNQWVQQAYILDLTGKAGDSFGRAIALSADSRTLAVSAAAEDSNATGIDGDEADSSASDAGAVYVYTRSEGVWSKQAYVKASNTDEKDHFGGSIALSADGNTLAATAVREDSMAKGINGIESDNTASNSGAVYVYTRSDSIWSQQAYIKGSNTEAGDSFGHSIALSADGHTMAVGANLEGSRAKGIDGDETNNSARFAGAAYVYTRSDNTWSQQAYIKASNTEDYDFFGRSITLSVDGNTLAVGAMGEESSATGIDGDETDNSVRFAGAVYVYTRSDDIWSQQAYIKASNTDTKDYFGNVITLSSDGNTLAVVTHRGGSEATTIDGHRADHSVNTSGAVSTYARSGSIWSQEAYIDTPNDIGDAAALSADGNTLAVGTTKESKNAIGDKKAVYLY